MIDSNVLLRAMDELLDSEESYTNQYRAFAWWRECRPTSMFATRWSLQGALEKAASLFSGTQQDFVYARAGARTHMRVAYLFYGFRGNYEEFWQNTDFATAKKVLQKAVQIAR